MIEIFDQGDDSPRRTSVGRAVNGAEELLSSNDKKDVWRTVQGCKILELNGLFEF